MIFHFYLKKGKLKKLKKHVANVHDKVESVIHIRNLKQVKNNGLVLYKMRRVITSNQKTWQKPYIDMNTEPKKMQKIIYNKISS